MSLQINVENLKLSRSLKIQKEQGNVGWNKIRVLRHRGKLCRNFSPVVEISQRRRPRKSYFSYLETARPFLLLLPFHWKQRGTNLKKNLLPPLTKRKKMSCHASILATSFEWRVSIHGQTRANPRRIARRFLEQETIRSTWRKKKNRGGGGKGEGKPSWRARR